MPSLLWWLAGWDQITGAYLAAVIIAEVKAICIGIGVVDFGFGTVNFSKLTLVAEFLVMAIVLIVRPYGLLGRPQGQVRSVAEPEDPIWPATPALKALGIVTLMFLLCSAAGCAEFALSAHSRHRRFDCDHFRDFTAFHHGTWRHAFVWACGLLRPSGPMAQHFS